MTPPPDAGVLAPTALAATDSAVTAGASAALSLTGGEHVDRYLIHDVLGAGGMGIVYRAHDPELGRLVALKLVRADTMGSLPANEGQARLLREAQAMAKLAHPNTVPVFDVGTTGDQVFIAMELIDGVSLGAWLRAQPRTWKEVLRVMSQAGRGLAAAHAVGLVHRDFKPENVLVGHDDRVRVVDFGLARPAHDAAEAAASPAYPLANTALGSGGADVAPNLTRTGAVVGTPLYMAPEQHLGEPIGPFTDQFSFCVTLYEALYGQRPFTGNTRQEVLRSVLAGGPAGPPRRANVPRWLHRIVLRGLASDPRSRFESMIVLLAALERSARRPWIAWTVAGTGAGTLALIALLFVDRQYAVPTESPAPAHPPLLSTTERRQLTFTGDADLPRLSPGGLTLAYVTGRAPYHRLVVQDLPSGRSSVLSWWPLISDVRWSPDGTRLLVATTDGVYIVPKTGGSRTATLPRAMWLAWSADGDAYVTADLGKRLVIERPGADTSRVLEHPFPSTYISGLDWSQEDEPLLIQTVEADGIALWTLDPDAAAPRKIVADPQSISGGTPRWFGQDHTFTYQRVRAQGPEIVAARLLPDGTTQELGTVLRGILGGEYSLPAEYSFSRDGTRLAYVDGHVEDRLVRVEPGPDGYVEQQIIGGTQTKRRPAVSPDGTSVAFAMGASTGLSNVFIVPLAGGEPRQLTAQASSITDLAWSPDGRFIAYGVIAESAVQLLRIDTTSGAVTRLPVTDMSAESAILWAPGRELIYMTVGHRNIGVLDPDTGARRRLIGDDSVGWIFLSLFAPDGKSIIADWNRSDDRDNLWRISLDDGAQTDLAQPFDLHPVGWGADGSQLYATTSRILDGSLAIVSLRPDGTRERLLTIPSERTLIDVEGVPGTTSFVAIDTRRRADVWLTGDFDPGTVATTAALPPLHTGQLPPGYPGELQTTLVNNDFEGSEPGRPPAGWHVGEAHLQHASVSTSELRPFDGHRCAELSGRRDDASVVQVIDAAPYRGQKVRLRGALRVELESHEDVRAERPGARLQGRVDSKNYAWPVHVRVKDPVDAADWTFQELTIDVPADAEFLSIGMDFVGKGTAWLDAVTLTTLLKE